jgi:chitinase
MGYYPGYQEQLMPSTEINWSKLTHIVVGPIIPNANGTLDESMYLDNVEGPRFARELSAAAKAHNVQPLLMIGGGGNAAGFEADMRTKKAVKKFVKNLYRAMDSLGYTGVDLDLEPDNGTWAANEAPLVRLVQGLRKFDPNVTITFPAIPGTTTFPEGGDQGVLSFYANSLAPLVDKFGVQSYNISGPYDGWVSWHFAPLYGEDSAATCAQQNCAPTSVSFDMSEFLNAGIPASKLMMGVGFFGACWAPETGARQAITGGGDLVASDNQMSYTNIVTDYIPHMTASYDNVNKEAQLTSQTAAGPQGCNWVSYEDATSIADKGAYAQAHGIGGAMIWTIPQGHLNGQDPLLVATHDAFGAL